MRILLDAHTLIWYVDQDHFLGRGAHSAISNSSNELLLSAATIWEIAIKVGLSKLTLSTGFQQWMSQAISDLGVSILPITVEYASVQATLPDHHRDPFDRILAAQAQVEKLSLVSKDAVFDKYGITRIW